MNGYMTPQNKYVLDLQLPCYHTDSRKHLRPHSFMDLAQEMAYLAADAMHFGYGELIKEGKAWVLSRFRFTVDSTPLWSEKLQMATWHKGPSGPFYLRDFTLGTPAGEVKVRATSSWVILDIQSRRMVRSAQSIQMVPETTTCYESAIEEPAPRLVVPKGMSPISVISRQVQYSDIDLLGHMNNARYVMWAMDALPREYTMGRDPVDVCVNFNHETKVGESLEMEVYRMDCEEGRGTLFTVEGRNSEGKAAVVVRVIFPGE